MKRITFTVSDQEHAAIKVAAAQVHLSIREYVLAKLKPIHELKKAATKSISSSAPERVLEGLDDEGNTRPYPGSHTKACPFCGLNVYAEYAQKHYTSLHEDSQA